MFRTDKLSPQGLPEAVCVYRERRSLFVAKRLRKEGKSNEMRFFYDNKKN